ncbi:MAG: PQQ-binding-like beta-propeller repeat protein, partial [Chloroflexi bacterium]|nr:PQQ-binding-like beta-propeller repeat protein [Chloroflexota bacterium]
PAAPTTTAAAPASARLIGDLWPNLPASFKLGVDGAAYIGGGLYLFKAGRYIRTDATQPPVKLTDLKNWPQTGPWQNGLVDLVVGLAQPAGVALIRGNQFLLIDPVHAAVLQPPKDLDALLQGDVLTRVKTGQVDALVYTTADQPLTAVQGPAVLTFANSSATQPVTSYYLPLEFGGWPVTWNPVLQQAPGGRVDGLWATTRDGGVVHHDGNSWNATDRRAVSVDVGVDGSVFAIGSDADQHQLFRLDGSNWTAVAQGSGPLAQVTVGDTSRVWVRDTGNAVHRLDQSDANSAHLVPEPLLGQTVHITANADGTLWSCDGSGGASRFISESTAPPQAIATGGAMKVTSTSYGTAHFLVQQNGSPQVHTYDSPYVFKTSRTYQAGRDATGMAQGLGRVFLLDVDRTSAPLFAIVALDAHTGEQLSVSSTEQNRVYTAPVFDPLHEVVYVGVAPLDLRDDRTGGEIRALDARDLLHVVWSYPTPAGVDAAPALSGTSLCFGDRTTTLHMLDTSNVGAGEKPTLRWHWQVFPPEDPQYRSQLPTPLLWNGNVYAVVWNAIPQGDGEGPAQSTSFRLAGCDAGDGSNQAVGSWLVGDTDGAWGSRSNLSPIMGQIRASGTGKPAVFVPLDARLCAFNLDQLTPPFSFTFPTIFTAGTYITSNLTYVDGVMWFGDYDGVLYAVDENLRAVHQTPSRVGQGGSTKGLLTTPVAYQGSILCGVADSERPGRLVAFDPDSGNLSSLDTAQTAIAAFSRTVTNGVLYAAGTFTIGSADPTLVPQALGIRVDELVQDQRDFIVESQLMQDFDGPQTPDGLARYQTHLTIVDDNKAPRPKEAVKLWGDQPTTLRVNGQTYTVGPGDPEYAAVLTGPDGTLTIVSGSVASDGKDRPDLFVPALRVWASFMDPH